MKRNYFTYMMQAVVLLCTSLVISSCDDIFASEDNPIASYLSMSDKDVTIKIGDTYKRTAIAVSGAVIEYSSDDEAVATVDNEGTVTGKGKGTAKITATATGYNTSGKKIYLAESKSYNVKVDPILVQSITITNPISTALFNETATLTATVTPANATDKSITWTSDKPAVATIDETTGKITALTAGSAKITATANDESGKTATFTVIVGLLPGKFTINAAGDQIQFAQGNLQATCTSADNDGSTQETWTWNFAANQWDYIGGGPVNIDRDGNGSVTTAGTLDLYGWSTAATHFGIHNSSDNGDYSGDFVDWGANIGTGWYTLSNAEWNYLFNRNTGGSVFGTDDVNFVMATINTDGTAVNGLILFPDDIVVASSEVTTAGAVNIHCDWQTKCTTDQWADLAAKGCVFLPATGNWGGNYGTRGNYWSSNYSSTTYAYYCGFNNGGVDPSGQEERNQGFAVRLVYPAQ